MSRVGKLSISIPDNVLIGLDSEKNIVVIKNDSKEVLYQVSKGIDVLIDSGLIKLRKKMDNEERSSAKFGMDRSNINNIINGLKKDFILSLEISGVGYKVVVDESSRALVLSLGHSHDICYKFPKNIKASFEKPNIVVLRSHDRISLGQVASEIISLRPVEPYKGKGLKLIGKRFLRKEGKKK